MDKSAPVTQLSIVAGTYGSGQTLTLSFNDEEANPDKIFYGRYSTTDPGEAAENLATTEYATPIELPASGEVIDYYIVYYAQDDAGNKEAAQKVKYTIDTRAPVTTYQISPQPNTQDTENKIFYHNETSSLTLSSPNPVQPSGQNKIYYTMGTDAVPNDPTTDSTVYANPIALPLVGGAETEYVIKFFAVDPTRLDVRRPCRRSMYLSTMYRRRCRLMRSQAHQ